MKQTFIQRTLETIAREALDEIGVSPEELVTAARTTARIYRFLSKATAPSPQVAEVFAEMKEAERKRQATRAKKKGKG